MSVWRDIALTMHEKVFSKYDAEKIDSHDIKVRKQLGNSLQMPV